MIARLAERDRAPAALRAAAGRPTLDYAVDLGPHARALVLDTVDRAGGSRGLLRAAQLAWLRDELANADGRALLVFSHNPLDNTAGGEAALAMLDATPGVVAVVAGNSHRNRIRPRAAGGYWEISTSSLADHPQQARALRLRRTADGYALETWMLDHDGRGLAGAARELAFLDAQGGRPQGFAGATGGPERAAVRRAMMPRWRAPRSGSAPSTSPPARCTSCARARTRRSCRARCRPSGSWSTRAAWPSWPAARASCTRARAAARAGWLIATLIAIFPANVNMAVNAERYRQIPEPLLWLRLPLQALLIRWAWRVAVRESR